MILTQKQFGVLNERLNEITKKAVSGILGNSRAALVDIKAEADAAKEILLEATIENDGPDAA